jgi:hypothetical protein
MMSALRAIAGFARELARQELRVADHARERLVQLVRRGPGEFGDHGLFLARSELFLRALELGLNAHFFAQIGEDAERAHAPAVLHDQRRGQDHRDRAAVGGEHVDAEILQPARSPSRRDRGCAASLRGQSPARTASPRSACRSRPPASNRTRVLRRG